MPHNIIMWVFECCSPHNVPLHSHPECIEQFSKIQEAFQRLEKSYTEIKACQRKIDNKEVDSDSEEMKQDQDEDYLEKQGAVQYHNNEEEVINEKLPSVTLEKEQVVVDIDNERILDLSLLKKDVNENLPSVALEKKQVFGDIVSIQEDVKQYTMHEQNETPETNQMNNNLTIYREIKDGFNDDETPTKKYFEINHFHQVPFQHHANELFRSPLEPNGWNNWSILIFGVEPQ